MSFPVDISATRTTTTTTAAPVDLTAFNTHFHDRTMRIDYFHTGDAKSDVITVDHLYEYGIWSGSRTKLIDNFQNGAYYAKVYDAKSGELLFSKGYGSLFEEYQMTKPAIDGTKRTFHETVRIPSPKNEVRVVIEKLNRKKGEWKPIFETKIKPDDFAIIREEPKDSAVSVYRNHHSGDPHTKVDVVIIGDGYTEEDRPKFEADLQRFTNTFFSVAPYKDQQDKFNVYGILKPSEESGCDEPRANIFKSTSANSSFNALGSERYLMTEDNKSLHDLASHAPYDSIYLMVNHSRYGGGGIYNQYGTFTADNQWANYVFIHEFGHSFTGLADEYYTSKVEYNDYYPRGIEPMEPNITALLKPNDLKWKNLVHAVTDIPTTWAKAAYVKMDLAWQVIRRAMNDDIARLKRERAPQDIIDHAQKQYDIADKEHSEKVDAYFAKLPEVGVVGAFEGAGYSSEGLYRPEVGGCIMFTKGFKPFCAVCVDAVERMIDHYTE